MSGKSKQHSRRRGTPATVGTATRRAVRPKTAPARRPSRSVWPVAALVLIAIVAVAVFSLRAGGSGNAGTTSTATTSLLAPVDTAATGAAVDGISCDVSEQVLFHIHAHLAVYVNGSARGIPAGIGIAPPRQAQQTDQGAFVSGGSCFYWLHSHTDDGVIHIESPEQRTFTLGDYFDIWGQPLGPQQVGPAQGTVIAYVDGKRVTGDPRRIALGAHTLIQLDVGQDVAPQPFTFAQGL